MSQGAGRWQHRCGIGQADKPDVLQISEVMTHNRPGDLKEGATAMNWGVTVCVAVGSVAVMVIQPWRFFWARRRCPQCKTLLPRWNGWGWKDDWTCPHCDCQISH